MRDLPWGTWGGAGGNGACGECGGHRDQPQQGQPLWGGCDCQSGSSSLREVPFTYFSRFMDELTPLFFTELLSSLYLTL